VVEAPRTLRKANRVHPTECLLIAPCHLKAALALWDYNVDSARWIFCNNTGDQLADLILTHLRRVGKTGITRDHLASNILQKNTATIKITNALEVLLRNKLANFRKERLSPNQKKPTTFWYAED
jgi:hypothetical protein